MKDLMITNEMAKYQEQAKNVFAKTGKVDMSAVIMGWKIEAGRVLADEKIGATIEITGTQKNLLYNVHTVCQAKNIDHNGQLNALQIGGLILRGVVKVYYGL